MTVNTTDKQIFFLTKAIIIAAVLLPTSAFAFDLSIPGIDRMMITLQQNYPDLRYALAAFSYLAGFGLIVKAVFKLRAYGQVRTMMPSHAEFMPTAVEFSLGIALIFLPTLIKISVATLWGSSSIIPYSSSSPNFSNVLNAVYGMIQILGLVAIIRGVLSMAKGSQKGAPPGTLGKGVTHFIGGVLAVNIGGVIDMLKASIGW